MIRLNVNGVHRQVDAPATRRFSMFCATIFSLPVRSSAAGWRSAELVLF